MRKLALLLLVGFLAAGLSFAEDISVFALRVTPGASFPLGEDSNYFGIGFGSDISADITLQSVPFLYINFVGGYLWSPLTGQADNAFLNLTLLGAGVGVDFKLFNFMHAGAFTRFGYSYGFLNDAQSQGGTFFVSGGVFVGFEIFTSMRIGLEAAYRNFLGLYNDISVCLGISYHFKPRKRPEAGPSLPELKFLKIEKIQFDAVFPVFYKYYDDHPIGRAVIKNTGSKAVKDIKITLYVKEYMDNPKLCGTIAELAPGAEQEIELFGLFTRAVLDISEGTKVSVNLYIQSMVDDSTYRNEEVQTLRLYDRNAITWEDDRRAAAFVTTKDPTVLTFAKNVSAMVKNKASKAINANLLKAIAIFEALKLYGITYVIDPSTPYKEFHEKRQTVDYLQFPKQTLTYKAGDCDDLSILYCALLESLGVGTAFITVPGHIYTAVNLNITEDEAKNFFSAMADLIVKDGTVWLPLEITAVDEGFLKAWALGAKEWREADAKKQGAFIVLSQAWDVYEPVGFTGGGEEKLSLPGEDKVVSAYLSEVMRFVDKELLFRKAEYEKRVSASGGAPQEINKLGVLYARFGKLDEAKALFEKALTKGEFLPAVINLGNIYYLEEKYEQALVYYEQAYKKLSTNKYVVLCMAKVHHQLENYSLVKKYYAQLQSLDKDLAVKYAYLELKGDEASRAADATAGEAASWLE